MLKITAHIRLVTIAVASDLKASLNFYISAIGARVRCVLRPLVVRRGFRVELRQQPVNLPCGRLAALQST